MKKSNQKVSQEINVSPEEAWKIIGAVDGVDKWLGPITACRLEGNKRYCSTEEGEFSEDILSVDHENRIFKYAIPTQHMFPAKNIVGEMGVVTSDQGKAIVNWSWEFEVDEKDEQATKDGLAMVGNLGIKGIEELLKAEVKA